MNVRGQSHFLAALSRGENSRVRIEWEASWAAVFGRFGKELHFLRLQGFDSYPSRYVNCAVLNPQPYFKCCLTL